MKYLLFISFLLLSSCSYNTFRFKIGECVIWNDEEIWEFHTFRKIMEYGLNNYKVDVIFSDKSILHNMSLPYLFNDRLRNIQCPK